MIFAVFLSVAYTTLNKLFAVFCVYYICGFNKEFIALCSLFGRMCMFQDLTTSLSIKFGANLFNIGTVIVLFDWLRNGGNSRVGFLAEVNFDDQSCSGTPFSSSVSNVVQIICNNDGGLAKDVS